MKPEIIFENADFVAFSKPSGLLSIPDRFNAEIPSLLAFARGIFPNVFVVHRLDKDTSGVLCFAKNEVAHRYLSELFFNHQLSKEYAAIVCGTPLQPSGSLNMPLKADPVKKGRMLIDAKGKTARTDYEVVDSWKHFSFLKVKLFTGRTHQIRVHLSQLGNPVVADPFYGDGKPFLLSMVKRKYKLSDELETESPVLSRLALHAVALSFKSLSGEEINITAPLPKDMKVMLKLLDKWDK